jgi:hypothetical protein
VAAGETDKVKQIKTDIQLNKFDPDELDKQMMGVKTQFFEHTRSIIKKRSSEALLIMYYNK